MLGQKGKIYTNWNELLIELFSLIYKGDIRMILGVEPKDQIQAIVKDQFNQLMTLFTPLSHEYGSDRSKTFLKCIK